MKRKLFKVNFYFIIMSVCLLIAISIFTNKSVLSNVYAYSSENATETSLDNTVKLNDERKFFSDSVQPCWFVQPSTIFYSDNYYVDRISDPVYKKYTSGDAINKEIYYVEAVDTTDVTVKLEPSLSEGDFTVNNYAQNHCGIIFHKAWNPVSPLTFANDNLSLKDIRSDLKIDGVKTWIESGKILYRTCPTISSLATFGNWQYIDLTDGASLFFNGTQMVQIVIIYELEEYKNIFNKTYHHFVAWYNFIIDTL